MSARLNYTFTILCDERSVKGAYDFTAAHITSIVGLPLPLDEFPHLSKLYNRKHQRSFQLLTNSTKINHITKREEEKPVQSVIWNSQ